MDKNTITKILETAVYAPSGDNSQPWHFSVKENALFVFMEPQKDNPIFNYRNRGTILSAGAVLENIFIASNHYGYQCKIENFPDTNNHNCVAKITFKPTGEKRVEELFDFIRSRSTNRKKYQQKPIDLSQITELANSVNDPKVEFCFTDNDISKKEIGKAVSINEVVMLENHDLHNLFFKDVRWTKKQEDAHQTGLYLKTMELDPAKTAVFWLLQFWPIAKVLNKIGIAKFIANENAKIYKTASIMGALFVDNSDDDFLNVGRAMQRIWLIATKLNLSLHLLTGVIFLEQKFSGNELGKFDSNHISLVHESYKKIENSFQSKNKNWKIGMLFRLGYGGEPSGRSIKIKPRVIFED